MAAEAAPVGVVIPAAGIGRRLGGQGAKAMVRLAGRSMLAHALADVAANRSVGPIVVVAHPDALEQTGKLVADDGVAKVSAIVPGGATRQLSVAAGLAALPPGPSYVAVHDAARPLAGPGCVDRLLELLRAVAGGRAAGAGAAAEAPVAGAVAGVVPGVPVIDTVRRVGRGGWSRGIVDREELRAIQTPQLFVRRALEEAHRLAARDQVEATDEAALVERAGYRIQVVPGARENLKVTTVHDLLVAEAILAIRGAWKGPP